MKSAQLNFKQHTFLSLFIFIRIYLREISVFKTKMHHCTERAFLLKNLTILSDTDLKINLNLEIQNFNSKEHSTRDMIEIFCCDTKRIEFSIDKFWLCKIYFQIWHNFHLSTKVFLKSFKKFFFHITLTEYSCAAYVLGKVVIEKTWANQDSVKRDSRCSWRPRSLAGLRATTFPRGYILRQSYVLQLTSTRRKM